MLVRNDGAHLLNTFASRVELGVVPGVPNAIIFSQLKFTFGSDIRCFNYCAYRLPGLGERISYVRKERIFPVSAILANSGTMAGGGWN